MISGLRIRKTCRKYRQSEAEFPTPELTIPAHFRCPISLDLMKDPVTLCTGITYDRASIDTWLDSGSRTCPVTNQPLDSLELIPNHAFRRMIQDWCVQNQSFGIERIPTPRVPITPREVSALLSDIVSAMRRKDYSRCRELVKKIDQVGRQSERDKRCIVEGGAGGVLSAAFDAFAAASVENHATGLGEILHVITWMFPLNSDARSYLRSSTSFTALVWLLKFGDLGGRRNAILAIREIVSSDQSRLDRLAATEGLADGLMKIIKEPICPTTTKASLVTIYHLVSSSNSKIAPMFADMGFISCLLEKLVDSPKSVSEKVLGVLDAIFSCEKARSNAYNHALTMPILVKKIFRVSELATEFAVSALSKLCRNSGEERILIEAVKVGAFQKVLLLLQVGCGEKAKEKATELLKILNIHRERGECIDSVDFKQLKRPF